MSDAFLGRETTAPVFSAERIAEIMAVPPAPVLLPTPEQRTVIEQPLDASVLVVAGAGSGKTETMANRVVWLVANGLTAPAEVLGLTFTRKAAGELNERIGGRLAVFTDRLLDAVERGMVSPAEAARAEELRAGLADGFDLPEVSTYNAFASAVVQEFGGFAGVAAGSALIDEATAWRIAREVVRSSRDPELVAATESVGTLVKRVLALDHAVSDNLTDFDRVEQIAVEFARAGELPYNEKAGAAGESGRLYAVVRTALENLSGTRLTVRLAREFAREKQRRGLIEFSDQLRLAMETVRRFPKAAAVLRRRTPVVLLDEVQDTSVGQTRLLSALFRGLPVMAVGDPHQSIYGWRGASADNLRSFHRDFGGASGAPVAPGAPQTGGGSRIEGRTDARAAEPGRTLSLSISWRNPALVLEAANAVAAPLVVASPVRVPRLRSRGEYLSEREDRAGAAETNAVRPAGAEPEAGSAAVHPVDSGAFDSPQLEWRFPETVEEEYAQLAEWMREAKAAHLARTGEPPTAAVVFRARAAMPAVAAALSAAGVPNRIVGVGGLLSTPEVTDLVSLLRCLWYADAGSELIRLLAGPRFRLGVADLAGLHQTARWFSRRDIAQQPLSEEELRSDRALADPDRQFTLLDAIDEIAAMPRLDHAALSGITETGRERLREAGRLLRHLRAGVGGDLSELLRAAEQALRLDIELDANERSGHRGGARARANLDAFADLVEGFLATDEQGTLASVLAWLERVGELDQVAEHVPEPEPGTVQLITGHGAKGLEWDLVAIPRLVAGEFPLAPSVGLGWLRPGELPDELRGDAAARPALNWRIATTQQELHEAVNGYNRKVDGATERVPGYTDALAELQRAEERRLAYVAITRAARRLLLTGSFWGSAKKPRDPSPFLRELEADGVISGLPERSAYEENPKGTEERTLLWPLDPLGARRTEVLAAAEAVRMRLDHDEGPDSTAAPLGESGSPGSIDPTVELLLAERAAAEQALVGRAPAPEAERITASAFHEFVEDPERAERGRLRPVPVRPYRRTRIGNRFHEWVERRATTARGTALPLSGFDAGLLDTGEIGAATLDLDVRDTGMFDAEGRDAGAADAASAEIEGTEAELRPLIENFERSRWADRRPIAVEQEVTMPFAGRTLVCKLDAVYREGDGADARYEVVDWKSGRPPRDDAERASRFLQLDLYRHAYARWAGVDPARIDVTLFYVAEGEELRGEGDRSLEELERLWRASTVRSSGS